MTGTKNQCMCQPKMEFHFYLQSQLFAWQGLKLLILGSFTLVLCLLLGQFSQEYDPTKGGLYRKRMKEILKRKEIEINWKRNYNEASRKTAVISVPVRSGCQVIGRSGGVSLGMEEMWGWWREQGWGERTGRVLVVWVLGCIYGRVWPSCNSEGFLNGQESEQRSKYNFVLLPRNCGAVDLPKMKCVSSCDTYILTG